MPRKTNSDLLPTRKTNAEKMKEAREAKVKAAANIDSAVSSPDSSEQPGQELIENTIPQDEPTSAPTNDLARIGTAAGQVIPERPKGYRPAQYVETKTKRVQLVFQPSLHERVKRAAKKRNLSVNEYVHQVLDYATQNE